MPAPPIRFDATRLLARAGHATPTGIDRVDLAYARALLALPDHDVALVAFDGLGGHRLRDAAARRLLDDTAARWSTEATIDTPVFAALRGWLRSPAGTPRPESPPGRSAGSGVLRGWLRRLHARGTALDASAAVYVNTSHGSLHRPQVADWLRRSGSRGVFFVHDLIPITHPQYNRPAEPARHAARLRTVAAHARSVIVNSAVTASALADWLVAQRLPVPPIEVIPLGVAEAFAPRADEPRWLPAEAPPYFVVLGTLEPRKNHALLLRLWPRLVAALPRGARLLCIGRRGWENAALFERLDGDAALRPWVVETAGLTDGEIAQLLRGARALLAPSFVEGFHLPVAEALACGCPVLASDIAVHREIGGRSVDLLDPRAEAAWLQALAAFADPAGVARAADPRMPDAVRPLRWPAHVDRALRVILAE